jgi:hypothetical protein
MMLCQIPIWSLKEDVADMKPRVFHHPDNAYTSALDLIEQMKQLYIT